MKKNLKFGIVVVILGGLAYMITKIILKAPDNKPVVILEEKSDLPAFSFQTLDGKAFTNSQLKAQPTLILYFDPFCEHCQQEANAIKGKKEALQNNNILFVSPEPLENIMDFDSTNQLNLWPNVNIVRDSANSFVEKFKPQSYPSVYVYGKTGKLVSQWTGYVDIDLLIKTLNE